MNEELDAAAAEYVLGTLPADERARLAGRLRDDPELRAAVRFWEARLAPLGDAIAAEAPPPELWRAIDAAAAADASAAVPEDGANVLQLRRRLGRWRTAALAAGALAAGLAGMLILDRAALPPESAGGRYVAVVDAGGREPALIAEVDTRSGTIRVRSLAAEVPSGHSLELWHVAENHAPRSLGILQAGADPQTIRDASAGGPLEGMIAVSVEPPGGSPSGAPTGPIVYSGRLIPAE